LKITIHPMEALAVALAATALIITVASPHQGSEDVGPDPEQVREGVSALLYSTLSYPGGATVTVGEALLLALKEGTVPEDLRKEVSSRLDFLFSPLKYQVIFFSGEDSQPLTFGDLEGGKQHLFRYTFSGEELGVIVSLEVR